MSYSLSNRLSHFFHVVSNIRPIVWIGLYVCITPIFALIYWALPEGQFRIPEPGGTDYGSWLYYSIVTITTLGFGDYTPAMGWAQAITAVEVMCGLVFLGFFLNAVGSMKSEIDVESEIEKQKRVHYSMEYDKLTKSIPGVMHTLNLFLSYCYAITTPLNKRNTTDTVYNPDFSFSDLQDLFKPSGLPIDRTTLPVVSRLMTSASQTSLSLDSLQNKVDMTLWPEILEDCFAFVANFQLFSNNDLLLRNPEHIITENETEAGRNKEGMISEKVKDWKNGEDFSKDNDLQAIGELYYFIKENAGLAEKLEMALTKIANQKPE